MPATDLLDPLNRATGDDSAATASAIAEDPDEIALAAESATDDWRPIVEPLTGPVEAMVDGAQSLEALREQLAAAIDAIDVEGLRERLARATFGARLAGDADVGQAMEGE